MYKFYGVKKKVVALCTAGALTIGSMTALSVPVFAAPEAVEAISDRVNVRASSVTGDVLFVIDRNQTYQVMGEETGSDGKVWYKITGMIDGQERSGWVRSDLVAEKTENQGETGTTEATEGTFNYRDHGYEFTDEIPDSVIPEHFSKSEITFDAAEIPALTYDNGDITLLYLESAENSADKKLFVYNTVTQDISPYVTMEAGTQKIFLLGMTADTAASDRYQETTLEVEDETLMAYQLTASDEQIENGVDVSQFYFLYGMDENGQAGWYVYNSLEENLQKNVMNLSYAETPSSEEDTAPAQEETSEEKTASNFEMDSVVKMLLAALGAVCLLLLILTIVFAARYRKLCNYLEDEDYDEEDWEEEDSEQTESEETPKRMVFSDADDDDEDFEEPVPKRLSRRERKRLKKIEEESFDQDAYFDEPQEEEDEDDFVSLQSILDNSLLKELEIDEEQDKQLAEDRERIQERIRAFDEEETFLAQKPVKEATAVDHESVEDILASLESGISDDTVPVTPVTRERIILENQDLDDIELPVIDINFDELVDEDISETKEAPVEEAPVKEASMTETEKVQESAEESEWDDLEFL